MAAIEAHKVAALRAARAPAGELKSEPGQMSPMRFSVCIDRKQSIALIRSDDKREWRTGEKDLGLTQWGEFLRFCEAKEHAVFGSGHAQEVKARASTFKKNEGARRITRAAEGEAGAVKRAGTRQERALKQEDEKLSRRRQRLNKKLSALLPLSDNAIQSDGKHCFRLMFEEISFCDECGFEEGASACATETTCRLLSQKSL